MKIFGLVDDVLYLCAACVVRQQRHLITYFWVVVLLLISGLGWVVLWGSLLIAHQSSRFWQRVIAIGVLNSAILSLLQLFI